MACRWAASSSTSTAGRWRTRSLEGSRCDGLRFLSSMSSTPSLLSEPLGAYYQKVAGREPPLLERLRSETGAMPMARMQIAAEEGQLLDLLIKLIGAKRCVEVGVFTGYSS